MHPLLIPLALLAASLFASKKVAPPVAARSGGPKPTPPPGGNVRAIRPNPIAAHKAIRTDPYAPPARAPAPQVQIEHPNVIPAEASQQAAVDAAMTQVIRDSQQQAAPDAKKKAAANALLQFLIKTGRFGGGKDRPNEVKAAQRDLGVKPDGIVGPKTRTAALNQGVALPPKP
jgi:peptidoglycan hydrolase-like protein with peptidoglycan-binding domain